MSMYDTSDPRSALNAPAKSGAQPRPNSPAAEYAKFYETEPQESDRTAAPGTRAARISSSPIRKPSRARPSRARASSTNTWCCCTTPTAGRDRGRRGERSRSAATRSPSSRPATAASRCRRAGGSCACSPRARPTSRRNARMPPPMPSRIRTFRRSSPGRSRRTATGSAATASTCRGSKAASAASSAAPPSW